MKSLINALFTLALLFGTISAWSDQEQHRYELRVDGLACPFCAYGIEKSFKAEAGVRDVEIDLERGLVVVTTQGRRFDADELEEIVDDAGFTLRGVEEKNP